jgi:hypothetical protein
MKIQSMMLGEEKEEIKRRSGDIKVIPSVVR